MEDPRILLESWTSDDIMVLFFRHAVQFKRHKPNNLTNAQFTHQGYESNSGELLIFDRCVLCVSLNYWNADSYIKTTLGVRVRRTRTQMYYTERLIL